MGFVQAYIPCFHTELLQYPNVEEVVACGIAFSGNSVVSAYATYDIVRKQYGDVILTYRYGQEEE